MSESQLKRALILKLSRETRVQVEEGEDTPELGEGLKNSKRPFVKIIRAETGHVPYISATNCSNDKEKISKKRPHLIELNKKKSFAVKITDVETNSINFYESIRKAAKDLEIGPDTVRRYISNGRYLKNKYLIELNK